ncbi:MAG: protein kinase [Planctomycetota bacterium]
MSGPLNGEDEWGYASEVPESTAGSAHGHDPAQTEPTVVEEPAPRLPRPRAGRRFGGFELLEELGDGAFGVVFRAREPASDREVALKVLTKVAERQRRRFAREGELTAQLLHPGIVRVHSAGEALGYPYLAYELIPGGRTYAELLAEADDEPLAATPLAHTPVEGAAPLPSARGRALRALLEVARAVAFAHARGVVHRDLKPQNVLLDPEGRARVADFGLAWSEGVDPLTQSGALIGTPTHMSPEQFGYGGGELRSPPRLRRALPDRALRARDGEGTIEVKREEGARIGPPADVWALGTILYRCLTGAPPFAASNLIELATRVRTQDPRPPRDLNPGVSPALEAVCLRALQREPGARYPDAGAFAEDLENALAHRPVSASRGSGWTGELGDRLRRSRRSLGIALGLSSLVVLSLLVGLRAPLRPADEELRVALVGARRDPLELATLAALVSRAEARLADPGLRAQGHLALARAAALPEAERRAHAARARALTGDEGDPALRVAAAEVEGELQWRAGDAAAAAAAWAAARGAGAASPEARLGEGAALLALGRPAEAAARAAELLAGDLRPSLRARALALQARAATRAGRLADADAALRALEPLSPGDAALLALERANAAALEDAAGARARWRAAARLHPAHAPLALARARFHLERGEAAAARAALAGAIAGETTLPQRLDEPPLAQARALLEALLARPRDHAAEHRPETPTAPPAGHAVAPAQRATEHATEHALGSAAEHTLGAAAEHALGSAAEHALGSAAEHESEHPRGPAAEHAADLAAEISAWRAAPAAWQELAARWWTAGARAELALAERSEDPQRWSDPAGTPPERRRARARAAAAAAAALPRASAAARGAAHALLAELGGGATELARAAALTPDALEVRCHQARAALSGGAPARALQALAIELPAGGPARRRALLLRGQALLALGRPRDAVSLLEELARRGRGVDLPACQLLARAYAEASEIGAATELGRRAALLAGQEREAAARRFDEAWNLRHERKATRAALLAGLQEVIALAPGHCDARAALARVRYAEGGDPHQLGELLWWAGRDPRLFTDAWRDLAHVSQGLERATFLTRAARTYPQDGPDAAWERALLRAAAAELEADEDELQAALPELDALVTRDPADLAARIARLLLWVRDDRRAEAEHELQRLREALPHQPLLSFAALRLAARRGAPLPTLTHLYRRLEEDGFNVWQANGWTVARYPELSSLAHTRGFERLLGPKDRR